MQLIEKVGQLHKMTSVQIAAAAGAVTVAEQIYPVIKDFLPPAWQAVAFVAVVIARAIFQPGLAK